MNMHFADRVQKLEPAAVYEILKKTGPGKAIAFAAGNPSPAAFPAEEVAELSHKILKEHPVLALQYGPSEGYAPLREQIIAYQAERFGISGKDNDLIITSGATQGIELCAKIFCNDGDTIITENPTFIGSLNSFASYRANVVGIDMEFDGMNMDKLEEALKREKNVRFIYVIPNFQNPSGWTMSLEKRKRVYELAVKYNTLILEDDPYGRLRYFGENIPSIKSFDTENIVLYAGSFSKTISPGLRVGFMHLPKQYATKMAVAKQASDVHTPMLNQMIVNEFMKDNGLANHIEKVCSMYRGKLQLTFDMLEKHLGDNVSYVKPEGGLYVFCRLPEHIDMIDYCAQALDGGVAIVWGNAFFVDPTQKSQYFRINFSSPSDEQLERGIEILGQTFNKMNG
ncbi:MAG: PLP-dependent aminotransferase family protein [Defluviitaleaceae bacterium]|nr:PLP-dependent aminotransferase family protein [Defluviitaleaceae bacterium]